MTRGEIRVAMVGCGAVAEVAHLPIVAATRGVRLTVLVDRNLDRAGALAKRYGVSHVAADMNDLAGRADAAILAVPHALHGAMGTELLRSGLHVLVEKPMALTAAECDQMIDAARESRVVLAVGLMRRFAPYTRFTKKVLDARLLGPIVSFQYREGSVYSWPVTSDFMFRKNAAGGGVLIDTGAHTLDTVLWWFGVVAELDYFDDADGGVDADCELRLTMASGATGVVELSRTRALGNTAVIRGERGSLEISGEGTAMLTVDGHCLGGAVDSLVDPTESGDYLAMMRASMHDWLGAIREGRQPLVTGEEGRRSVALIEACYRERRPLVYPWEQTEIAVPTACEVPA